VVDVQFFLLAALRVALASPHPHKLLNQRRASSQQPLNLPRSIRQSYALLN
jgi:hypothetical protein